MKNYASIIWLVILAFTVSGCAHQSTIPPSQGHIDTTKQASTTPESPADIPQPIKKSVYLPPPKKTVKPQTYSVVVNDVPIREILFALARESKLNIDIHPGISGNVTLNAVDQTLPAILERVSKQVDLRYKMEGNTLTITPDIPSLRTYKVNYVNMDRDTAATLGVGSEISTAANSSGSTSGSSSSSSSGSGGASRSTTTINSKSKVNFWELLSENVRNILKSSKSQVASAEERATKVEALKQAQESRLKQVEAVSHAGAGAENLFKEAFNTQTQPTLNDSKDDVIVNPIAGTITVMATEKQQAYIQQYIESIMSSVQRQVLIEATIVEVTLSDAFKTGVDWSRLGSAGGLKGFTFRQNLTGVANLLQPTSAVGAGATTLTTPGFILGYNNTNSPLGDIAASISWLQTFGNTKVLSSPKIMAINNQSALLKVVDNTVYFKVDVTPATISSTGSVISPATFSTTPQNVSVGVVMSVTPQINENGNVTLNVRPTISRIIDFVNDPNPQLATAGVTNLVPEIQVREMESVLQVGSGQTIVMGGLMQDKINNQDKNIPTLSKLPLVGDLFKAKNDTTTKTELVIFIRPTVITNASLESQELQSFKQYLPDQLPAEVTNDESAH